MLVSHSHFKVVCKICGDVLRQCRCIGNENPSEYSVCAKEACVEAMRRIIHAGMHSPGSGENITLNQGNKSCFTCQWLGTCPMATQDNLRQMMTLGADLNTFRCTVWRKYQREIREYDLEKAGIQCRELAPDGTFRRVDPSEIYKQGEEK